MVSRCDIARVVSGLPHPGIAAIAQRPDRSPFRRRGRPCGAPAGSRTRRIFPLARPAKRMIAQEVRLELNGFASKSAAQSWRTRSLWRSSRSAWSPHARCDPDAFEEIQRSGQLIWVGAALTAGLLDRTLRFSRSAVPRSRAPPMATRTSYRHPARRFGVSSQQRRHGPGGWSCVSAYRRTPNCS